MNTSRDLRALLSALLVAMLLIAPAHADLPTVRAETRSTALGYTAEATLEAINQTTVSAQMPGRVVELGVDAGDTVSAGERLLRIDASEASQVVAGADAAVSQAQALQTNARLDYERVRSLAERGFVSQSSVDQARSALDAADAQLRAARAGRGQAVTVLGYADVVSPFAGTVSERHVEPGEMAQPGMALITLYDPSAMRAVVDVPQGRFSAIELDSLGASVEFPDTGRRVTAIGVSVLPAADARTHTLRIRVELPPDLEGVLPGAFARVHFSAGTTDRIVVPRAAVVRRSEVTGVYVTDPRTGFSLRQIRVGEPVGDDMIEVLAGLAGGEEIALDPVQAGIIARAARAAGR